MSDRTEVVPLRRRAHARAARARTPAALHSVKPISLTTGLIDEVRSRNPDLDPALIDDIVLGVVTPVGEQGAVIARTAALAAGLPDTVAGVQLNRFCASGLEAVNTAAQKVRLRLGGPRARRRRRVHVAACRWAPTAAPGRWTPRPPTRPASSRRASAPT